jgi:twinkle protein
MAEDSEFVQKEPCPTCNSVDNLGRYDDGHAYCFTTGCDHYEPPTDGTWTPTKNPKAKLPNNLPDLGDFLDFPSRSIRADTSKKMRYSVGIYQGKKAHIVNVPNGEGKVVAQKIRLPDKDFRFIGDTKKAGLVFQDIWPAGCAKKIVVTEGELDALAVAQAQQLKYPAVSIPNGVDGAVKAVTRSLKYLLSFDEIIFMFDMDDVGQEAAKACAMVVGIKARIASLTLKDACDMLKAGKAGEIVAAIFNAQAYRPDGIVTLSSLKDKVLADVEVGKPWIFPTLNKLTYGRRVGELYFIGAGSGIGKTDFITQQIVADIQEGDGVALFLLEQPVNATGKRLCGKYAGKRFHVPDAGWVQEELMEAFDDLEASGNCFLYDHFGAKDWDAIEGHIRWLAAAEGVRHFYIDHMSALVADAPDERREIERITARMSSVAQELRINPYVISHLSTPEGAAHEEGGQVRAKHFKGSRSIIFWSHFMFGLERNTQATDKEERSTTTFRVVKDRFTGQSTGETFHLGYDVETGRMAEKTVSKDNDSAFSSEPDF